MFGHVVLIATHEANERCWQLAAACQPHLIKSGQEEGWRAARKLAEIGRVAKSAVEMVGDDVDTRIDMIGSHLKLHGDRWAAKHRAQMDWLASAGVTPEQAIERHEAWMERVMSDPFWRDNQ